MIVALLLAAAGLAFLAWSLAADPAAALDTLARARLELLALGALCLLGQTALVAATWSRLLVCAMPTGSSTSPPPASTCPAAASGRSLPPPRSPAASASPPRPQPPPRPP
jgi:hypothetical protein